MCIRDRIFTSWLCTNKIYSNKGILRMVQRNVRFDMKSIHIKTYSWIFLACADMSEIQIHPHQMISNYKYKRSPIIYWMFSIWYRLCCSCLLVYLLCVIYLLISTQSWYATNVSNMRRQYLTTQNLRLSTNIWHAYSRLKICTKNRSYTCF